MQQTLDQKRAKHAWDAVEKAEKDSETFKQVCDYYKKLPSRILSSGLGPTIAFMRAKGDGEPIRRALQDWINLQIRRRENDPEDLFERIMKNDSTFLRRVTEEVMAYLQWYNRFVEPRDKAKKKKENEKKDTSHAR